MLAQAVAEMPNECCGFLAGPQPTLNPCSGEPPLARVSHWFPLVNALHSPKECESEPRSLIHADKQRRALGLEFLAVYHSHPTTDPVPSRTDLERKEWWPGVVWFIISLKGAEPVMQGWWPEETRFTPAEWDVVE
jgi:proteasome lid subunit RPN8/RPN11